MAGTMERAATGDITDIPGPRGMEKFKGLLELSKHPLEYVQSLALKYGDVVGIDYPFEYVVFLFNPEHIEYILHRNYRNYVKQTGRWRAFRDIVGNGLLSCDEPDWRSQRQRIQPSFNTEQLNKVGLSAVGYTEERMKEWAGAAERHQPLEMLQEFFTLSLTILTRALFGEAIDEKVPQFVAALTKAHEYINPMALHNLIDPPRWLLKAVMPGYRDFDRSFKLMKGVVEEAIENRRRSGTKTDDLLSNIMRGRDEETGTSMSGRQLLDEALTMVVAGHETVSLAMSYALLWIAKTPGVEHTLRAELHQELGGRRPTLEDLPQLKYLRMVIQETLRITPPAWGFDRRAVGEDFIGSYRIPPKASVAISIYAIQHHPKYWDNPEQFDPLRFSDERSRNRPEYAFLPFGGGPRRCVGMRMAMMQMDLMLATMLQKYIFRLVPGISFELQPMLNLRPKNGVWMTLEKVEVQRPQSAAG
jgi:cytochrome P450